MYLFFAFKKKIYPEFLRETIFMTGTENKTEEIST